MAALLLLPSFSSCYGAALPRNSTKKATTAAVTFFCLVWSYVATQLHEKGDGSCTSNVCSCGVALQRSIAKKATLRCNICFAALQCSKAKELFSSSCCGAAL
jgi:hypothetical protein